MFLRFEALFTRARNAAKGDGGASLILVIGLMLVGFLVASVIASACLFAIGQAVNGKGNVQSFAAAEAGRDVAVASMAGGAAGCTASAGYYSSATAPAYKTWAYAVTDTDRPSAYPAGALDPTTGTPTATNCPTTASTYVILRTIGTSGSQKSVVDSVYTWSTYRNTVAGGGLGYMDASYNVDLSHISGDVVLRHGDFSCGWGTVFDGSVYVLDGSVNVDNTLLGGTSCTITGDLIVSGSLTTDTPSTLFGGCLSCGYLKVGGQIKVATDVDLQGRVDVGTSSASAYKDVTAQGRIHLDSSIARLTTFNGGSVKALGEIRVDDGSISSAGTIVTNTTLTADDSVTATASIAAGLDIAGAATITAGGSMLAGRSFIGNGARNANGGDIQAVSTISNGGNLKALGSVLAGGDITGGGSVTATNGNVSAGGVISGGTRSAGGSVLAVQGISSGTVTTTNGDIWSGAAISGTGAARTAGGSVKAVGDISAGAITAKNGDIASGGVIRSGTQSASKSVTAVLDIITNGTVTATANDVVAGGTITSGAVTAGGSVKAVGDISTAAAVQAKTGNISTNGSILGTGNRIAGTAAGSPGGDLTAGVSITSSASTTARDVLASGNITISGNCTISRDVQTRGTLSFASVINNQKTGFKSPTCTIGANLYAGSTTASTLGTYTAPTNGKSNGTFPLTQLKAASPVIRVQAWAGGASYYLNSTFAPTSAPPSAVTPTWTSIPTVTAPPAPAAPPAPVVAPPAPITFVLNDVDPADSTWESFDDLQLRTTWIDLGTYTDWGTTYARVPALSGATCTTWFTPLNQIYKILSSSGNVYDSSGKLLAPANTPVVIDATGCGTVNVSWSSFKLARDAIILVNNANFSLASFGQTGASVANPRQLFVVQVDWDNGFHVPVGGGAPQPVPNCSPARPGYAAQTKVSMTATGLAGWAWDPAVNVMLYSPCGISGAIAASWQGHLYVHNTDVTDEVLVNFQCEAMKITNVIDLPCDIDQITTTGQMNVTAYRLGDRVFQKEGP